MKSRLRNVINETFNRPKLNDLRYIGLLASYLIVSETYHVKTAGVSITNKGVRLFYNPNFIKDLTDDEVKYLILHEVFHVLLRHQERSGERDHRIANIAMDMILNDAIYDEIIRPLSYSTEMKGALRTPSEYDGRQNFESLYEWLMDKKSEYEQSETLDDHGDPDGQESDDGSEDGNEDGESNGEGSKDGKSNKAGNKKRPFKLGEGERVLSEEEKEHMIDKVVNEVKNRLAGSESSNFAKILKSIRPNKEVDLLKQIGRHFSLMKGLGIIQRTYKKMHRVLPMRLKGKQKLAYQFNVIVDTSGSMDDERFNKVMGLLIIGGVEMNLIQADNEVKGHIKITDKKDISDGYKRIGFGGTDMQPAIDYVIADKDMRHLPLVLLTDGYAPRITIPNKIANKSVVITTDVKIPTTNTNLKQIVLTEKYK